MDYVCKRMRGRSFQHVKVDSCAFFNLHNDQNLIIMENSSGVLVRTNILRSSAKGLNLTTQDGVTILHVKSTVCPVNVVSSTKYIRISSYLINFDLESEQCVGIMLLEALLDTVLQFEHCQPQSLVPSGRSARATDIWEMRFDEKCRFFYFMKLGQGKGPVLCPKLPTSLFRLHYSKFKCWTSNHYLLTWPDLMFQMNGFKICTIIICSSCTLQLNILCFFNCILIDSICSFFLFCPK